MAFAFISSPVRFLDDIRKELHALSMPHGRTVYIDEIDHPRTTEEPTFVTIADLFREIRNAEVLVVLLATPRHGSGLRVGADKAHATYWEAELFYAVLRRKPVHVFQTDDFRPDPGLAALLSIIERALPRSSWYPPVPRRALVGEVRDLLDRETAKEKRSRRVLAAVVDGFSRLRERLPLGGHAEHESLQFFDDPPWDVTVTPNEAVIERLFTEIETERNEELRLARLWVIFRELTSPYATEAFFPYWNRFYGAWGAAGSWYGLHSHHYLAVLPAFVQQAKVRMQMKSLDPGKWDDADICYPGGGLASTRYSVAGTSGSWFVRRRLLHAARSDVNRSLHEGIQNTANLLAIRGSIHRELGAIFAAVADYEDVLRRRRDAGADNGPIGEALAELGFGYLYQLRLWKGRSYLEEGVRLLEKAGGRTGFLVRAKRKLAMAYRWTGARSLAHNELQEAQQLAERDAARDQLRR